MKENQKIEETKDINNNDCGVFLNADVGRFNIFKLDPSVGSSAKPITYQRRDFYKISLIIGNVIVHYADKVIEVKKQGLIFSNPLIPYNWVNVKEDNYGLFCIFTPQFFEKFNDIADYAIFQPNNIPVIELSDDELVEAKIFYDKMFKEIESEYVYKYDVLRTLTLELIHFGQKLQPTFNVDKNKIGASNRITNLFLELLERQFPIDESHPQISLRSASDFANQLNVHVNHLNRAVKETTKRTTTQIITDRILQESKILLKNTSWNISEIAYSLGFSEPTHFNNFFKKNNQINPSAFRNV